MYFSVFNMPPEGGRWKLQNTFADRSRRRFGEVYPDRWKAPTHARKKGERLSQLLLLELHESFVERVSWKFSVLPPLFTTTSGVLQVARRAGIPSAAISGRK